jgi:2-dehydro-3-deoxyphosphooctonate aldolase (KDO 8-P synthase)
VPNTKASLWQSLTRRDRLFLIAGPCVIESEELCLRVAAALEKIGRTLKITCVFKASYDKANRTSGQSHRGPGLEKGLAILERVRAESGLPLLTDVHTPSEASAAAAVVDILQIPAFLCRQTDLVQAAARTGRIVNIKKGQFLSPPEMRHVTDKAVAAGNKKLLISERGTTFGYNNLVVDMRAIPLMRQWGFPVIFDATHSVQLPGGAGDRAGGQREFVPVLARAAVAAGADGVFIETHPEPDRALSDGPNMLRLRELPKLAAGLLRLQEALG